MRMETEVRILGNLAKFLSNVLRGSIRSQTFFGRQTFSAVAYGPGSISLRFREISWPLFVSCLQNIRERQNDFGLESNLTCNDCKGEFSNHL